VYKRIRSNFLAGMN